MVSGVFAITGVMASGKSTVAELLAKRFDKAVHVRGDAFRRMIVAGREEMTSEPGEEALRQLDLRYRIAAEVTKRYAEAGFTVVVQDNYLGGMWPRFLSMLEPLDVTPIVLCPSAETIRRREAERGKRGYVGFTVEGLCEGFLRDTPRIGRWIDTSGMTAEETVEAILAGGEG